jgi:predicted nucleotide-binding protein
MDAFKPSLFIASSSEGLPVARALQAELDDVCEPVVWSQAAFGPAGTTIGSLLARARNCDFAALVVTPDDLVVTRGTEVSVGRDNVIFELGMFMAALGPERVFIIQPYDKDLRLPSNLAGVTCLKYRSNRADRNLQAAIGPAANAIRNRIDRKRTDGGQLPHGPSESIVRFCEGFSRGR